MDENKTKDFVASAFLPAILELTKTVSSMTAAQEVDHQKVELALQTNRQETEDMKQSMGVLVKTISKLSEPIAQLVSAVNQSNELQKEHNQLLLNLQDSVTEQNARISVLNKALTEQMEDPGIQAMYEQLKGIGRA